MDTTRATPELWGALSRAQSAVGSVGRDGTNTQRGYRYATTEAMIRGSRQHLAAHGLAFVHDWATSLPEVAAGDIGKQHVAARVLVRWTLAHEGGGMVSGEAPMDAIGSPARPPDKAVAAAVTYGLGFVLRGLLLLDRADEDEHAPDRRQEPEEDRLWLAYEAKRAAVAQARQWTSAEAHEEIKVAAGVMHNNDATDSEVEAMIAAAERMLQPPPREPLTPGEDRDRAAVKGEQQTEPAKTRGAKGKAKAAPKAQAEPPPVELTPEQKAARAELAAARKAFTSAGNAYAEECKAQGVKPRPWQQIAGAAIGREWLESEPHTTEEWTAAAAAFENEIDHVRRGEVAA